MIRKTGGWWQTLLGCTCLMAAAVAQATPASSSPAGGPAQQAVAAVDPAIYNGYVGHYRFLDTMIMTVSRDGNRLLIQLTGEPPLEIFPSSKTQFFTKSASVMATQFTFEINAQGRATSLTKHQKVQDITAPRMDEHEAQLMEDTLAARVKSKTPVPGSEAALRRNYAELSAGNPHYKRVPTLFARQTLPELEAMAQQLGTIESVEFRGVSPQGWDIYDVHHWSGGESTFQIALSQDGKIAGLNLIRWTSTRNAWPTTTYR